MRVFWCSTHPANFGDALGPILLRHFGIAVEYAAAVQAELVTCGSVLSRLPDGWRGTVLGTGFIRRGMTKDLSRARVLSVRGVLTRRALGLPRTTSLGDPGVLVPEVFARAPHEGGTLLVPHAVDHDMVLRHPGTKVGAIRGGPAYLVAAISSADLVITSSLHGLIAADALGIPHVLEPHPKVVGEMFKFRDYASALGEEIRPGVERLSDRRAMAKVQGRVRALFMKLAKETR